MSTRRCNDAIRAAVRFPHRRPSDSIRPIIPRYHPITTVGLPSCCQLTVYHSQWWELAMDTATPLLPPPARSCLRLQVEFPKLFIIPFCVWRVTIFVPRPAVRKIASAAPVAGTPMLGFLLDAAGRPRMRYPTAVMDMKGTLDDTIPVRNPLAR